MKYIILLLVILWAFAGIGVVRYYYNYEFPSEFTTYDSKGADIVLESQ